MKKYRIIQIVLIAAVFLLFHCNVFADETVETGGDRVEIVALSPNYYENYSDAVTFTATVNYQLQSKEQGVVCLGFNTNEPHYYEVEVQDGDHAVVSKGSGTVTLTQTVTPVDWGSGYGYMKQFLDGSTELVTDFKVYANISEYPHDVPWTPLAICEAVVTELPEEAKKTDILFGKTDNPDTAHFDLSPERILAMGETTEYNPKLAHLLIALCNSVHDEQNIKQSFINMGFNDYVTDYSMNDPWLAYGLAKKELADGTTLVLVVTRGTKDPVSKESLSNLDMFFRRENRHKGFADAADSLRERLEDFLGTNDYSDMRFVLTGHSRGAAAVNLLAADMIEAGVSTDNITAYNFACPDVEIMTKSKSEASQYASIYNIGHANDFVSWCPSVISESGSRAENGDYWNKYGNSYWYAEDWENENSLLQKMPGGIFAVKARLDAYHGQNFYLDFLSKEKSLGEYKNREETTESINIAAKKKKDAEAERRKKKSKEEFEKFEREYRIDRLSIFCPVDIEVLDANGNRVAYTENDIPFVEERDGGQVALFVEDDRKRVFLENMNAYRIIATGRSSGTMLFEVQSSDDGSNYEDSVQSYENVNIEADKVFSWEKSTEDSLTDVKLLLLDSRNDGKVVAEIQQDGSEIKTEEVPEEEPGSPTVEEKDRIVYDSDNITANTQTDQSTEFKSEAGNFITMIVVVTTVFVLAATVGAVIFLRKRNGETRKKENNENVDMSAPNMDTGQTYCIYCGKMLLDGAEFCSHCGKKQVRGE